MHIEEQQQRTCAKAHMNVHERACPYLSALKLSVRNVVGKPVENLEQ